MQRNNQEVKTPLISLNSIDVTFPLPSGPAIHAVSDVNLTIQKGEIFGIVGLSGAGKSTLARVINLLQKPTKGSVEINGVPVTHYTGAKREKLRQNIGMIFQHFNLISGSSVAKNIEFNLRASGYDTEKIQGRVTELLSLVGLSDRSHAYPSQLSGGQKQRVAIARALANNPEILICDEATSALDPETTNEIVGILRSINQEFHITIVFITHQMEVAKKLFDRIAVMDAGHIVEINDTYTLFTEPKHICSQRLVERIIDVEIPEELVVKDGEVLLKITYTGQKAYNPIIATVVRLFAIDLSIVNGQIEYINGKPIGVLVVLISGDQEKRALALQYLQENTSKIEVIQKEQLV